MGLDTMSIAMEKYAPFVSYSPEVPPHECFITPEQIDPAIKNLIISDCSRFRDQTKELLQPDQTEKFLDFLKGNLPRDLYESLKNIETKDLANIIAAIILGAILIATGMAVIPAIAAIGTRLGISALFVRLISLSLARPGTVSAIMGVIPGMKMLAPNPSIAMMTNFIKDLFSYTLPAVVSKLNTPKK